jgi:hypothetical protein
MIKYTSLILAVLLSLASCEQSNSNEEKNDAITVDTIPVQETYKATVFHYDSLNIPEFFSAVVANHIKDYLLFDSIYYYDCENYGLDAEDSLNIRNYLTVKILHDLLTSESAIDCSKGSILDIPYMWHYQDPNLRYEIYFTETNTLLVDSAPPAEFKKYRSYADIDRTPYLYLSDLLQESPKYYSPSCDTFCTFGWCSEREMAFTALMRALEFNAKVMAPGIHSWTEMILPMRTTEGKTIYFKARVDNTYDSFDFEGQVDANFIAEWEKDLGTGTPGWYNRQAFSKSEAARLKNYIVPEGASERVEARLVDYINRSLLDK